MAFVEYEWNPAKAKLNLKKHGVRFADAVAVLEDELALTMRDQISVEEDRWITLGQDAFGRALIVVYTWRDERIRIIPARRATARERWQYEEHHET